MNRIKAGYQLHITTWENDGDDYETKIIDGLTEDEVKFYLFVCDHFKMRGLYGNNTIMNSDLIKIFDEAHQKFPNINENMKDSFCTDLTQCDLYDSLADQILGYPSYEGYRGQGNFCRVYDRFKVYYFPAEVSEISSQFK